MQTKKMSLASIQGKLSRAEMKNIMAGSSANCKMGDQSCNTDSDCSNGGTGCKCGTFTKKCYLSS